MSYFLVVYDRLHGTIVGEIEEFADQRDALRERFATEAKFKHDPNIEVVVLGARSRADLESTHARYFKTVTELIDAARRHT
jgi:hypothetical protein